MTERITREHGFAQVDLTPRPRDWVECLDKLQAEPFYRDYKARVKELLAPEPGARYLEMGAGAGTDAIALGAPVLGIDRSRTMCKEARARGLLRVVVAVAEKLPLRSAVMDGCWSDRTFQHLEHPRSALEELFRVCRNGGRVLTVDPDYSTQRMNFPDESLARTVLAYREHHAIRNGNLGHRMARLFRAVGFERTASETATLVVRDPTAVDSVMGLRTWARGAKDANLLSSAEVERWEALYDQVVARGEFEWAVTFFLTHGRKPL